MKFHFTFVKKSIKIPINSFTKAIFGFDCSGLLSILNIIIHDASNEATSR